MLTSIRYVIFAIKTITNKNNDMKTISFASRLFVVPLVTMLCAFFVAPLHARGQDTEAYVQMSADKKTLSFFYDNKRGTREGTTWDINKKKNAYGSEYPAWAGIYEDYNTTTTKAVIDASFANFRPTSTAGWFQGLKALTTVEGLQNLNTSEVKSMNSMFEDCVALTTLDLKSFNTSKVETMKSMFERCKALQALDLKSFNTSKVETMSSMFQGCGSLTGLNLKSFNTSEVKSMHYMFQGCYSLTYLDLNSFNTSKVTDMVCMFMGCSSLGTIACDKAWSCQESGDMFESCRSLEGAVSYDSKKTNAQMANPTTGYFFVTGPEVLRAYVQMSADKKTLTFFYDNKRSTREGTTWDINKKKNAYGSEYPAWAGIYEDYNTTTTKAVIDASFANFRPTSTAGWFQGLKALTTVEGLQNLNTSEVKSMNSMFEDCVALTTLDLKSFNTSKVETMKSMFERCKALQALDLKSFNTSKVETMSSMFQGCGSLTGLNLKSFNTSEVKSMHYMFQGCYSLTYLDLNSFNTSKVTDMVCMFMGCSSLGTIACDKAWSCQESGDMFESCRSLEGAVSYDSKKTNAQMANPTTGYFSQKPAGIESLLLPARHTQGIYTLQGKRINGSLQHLPAGVYIVNGKKVVVDVRK